MRRWIGCAVVLAAMLAACGGSDEGSGKMQVIVDGDGAIDDVKGLVYLLEQPDVDVLAVTVSGTGVAHCPVAAENIAAMMQRIGVSGIPVACGRTTPLEGNNTAPQAWRNAADTLSGVDLPEPSDLEERTAVELLADTLDDADDVVLVALGPLTNIAEAFEDDPSLIDHVSMMYLMGGAVDVDGNVLNNPQAEFNIWADPRAAEMVFATDVPITLVPLDSTNVLPVTPYVYDAIAAHRDASPVAEFMAEYLDVTPLYGGMYHWDELAAVAAVDESVVTLEERTISIVAEGGVAAGATVESDAGKAVRVAVDADPDKFADHFYAAMIGTSEPNVAAWEPDAVVRWDGTECTYTGPDPMLLRMWIRIDNESPDPAAFVLGRYAEGTTAADYEAFVASDATEPPEWWLPTNQIFALAGAHEVWEITGGPDITSLCVIDENRFWELAGPKLSE